MGPEDDTELKKYFDRLKTNSDGGFIEPVERIFREIKLYTQNGFTQDEVQCLIQSTMTYVKGTYKKSIRNSIEIAENSAKIGNYDVSMDYLYGPEGAKTQEDTYNKKYPDEESITIAKDSEKSILMTALFTFSKGDIKNGRVENVKKDACERNIYFMKLNPSPQEQEMFQRKVENTMIEVYSTGVWAKLNDAKTEAEILEKKGRSHINIDWLEKSEESIDYAREYLSHLNYGPEDIKFFESKVNKIREITRRFK